MTPSWRCPHCGLYWAPRPDAACEQCVARPPRPTTLRWPAVSRLDAGAHWQVCLLAQGLRHGIDRVRDLWRLGAT